MNLIGIAVIIITTVVCVHFVYERGKKDGSKGEYDRGVADGRIMILEENIKRQSLTKIDDRQIMDGVAKLIAG